MALHYEEHGDRHASLMLFLHGGGVSNWMWDKQIKYFTQYHCIAPILPEHGSSQSDMIFSIKGCAEQLIQLIEEKAIGKKVIVIGFSLGSQILIEMLSMKPNLIDVAIINSASVIPIPYSKTLIKPTIALTFPLVKNKIFSKLQSKTLYIDEDYFETYYKESCQLKRDTLVRVLEENMTYKLPKDFNKAAGSILVTVGAKEKGIMKNSAKAIVAANSNCTGIIIHKTGHGVSLAMPDFFNRMVEEWIDKGHLPKECTIMT